MIRSRITSQSILEVVPCNSSFAEQYLHRTIVQKNIAARRQAIHEGVTDAEAGKLTSLATVKAKWLSR